MKMIVRSQVIFENNGMLLAYLLCYIIRARPHEKMCGINFDDIYELQLYSKNR